MSEQDQTGDAVILRVLAERVQGLPTRTRFFNHLEEAFGKPVVTFFTSMVYPVRIEDSDVDMLAGALQTMDLSNGLILMISSLGGDGLAAERMINVCRSYSKTGNYEVIIPGKAKSAATLVCFGASKLYMGPTSELGPVDPQVPVRDGDWYRWLSAFHIVESYETLFEDAVVETGNLEPYLQQLQKYDAAIISSYKADIELSKDISIRALKTGMMSECSESEIERNIRVFLTPEGTKTHGRPIFRDQARDCRLVIEKIEADGVLWDNIYELYTRTNAFVSGSDIVKCIETKEHSFGTTLPEELRR